MSTVIDKLEQAQLRRVPEFAPGDTVKVHFQVIEGNRRRTQVFEGVVLKRQGEGVRETFTVRKQSFGVGVERTFPLHSPKIEKIDVAARGEVRRAKLYYLRDRVGKGARVRESEYAGPEEAIEPGLVNPPPAPEPEAGADGADGEAPAGEEPASDVAAAAEEPVADETPADEAPAEEPASEEPAAEAPADEPVAEEPAAEEASAEEPAAEAEPAAEEPEGEASAEEAPGGDADGDSPPADEA